MAELRTEFDAIPVSTEHAHASKFDNMHVLLWLIKDTCWMLEWRVLGTAMILPTIAVAVFLAVRSRLERLFWINLAICFWISANSYWMLCEFFGHEDIKNWAGLPFAFGFAAVGMAVTSYMKTFQHMDWINFFLLPMFLFSATFYPITVYPEWVQALVMAFPLWHGVELVRGFTTGVMSPDMWIHILYYLVMIAFGLVFTTKRLRALFLD